MGLHHLHRRKLIPEICELICHGKDFVSCSSQTDCINCFKICLTNPQYPYYNYPPPPSKIPPPFYLDQDQKHQQKISTYLIFTLALLAAIFFLVCFRMIYTKLRSRRRTTTTTISSTQQRETTHDDFLDEEQGPMMLVDHPIWYIRTQGLHHSIINSITICKYKKGEGLIEGTECSVCLSEFQDDESLRLLPKCHHAFHLPCIDTWLRSHTNCPMCRAPIVSTNNPSIPRIPSLDSIVVDSSSSRMEILENNSGELENSTSNGSDSELRNSVMEEREMEIEEVVNVRPRRSVSLDDTLVGIANINLDIANVVSGETSDDSDRVLKVIGNENLATTSNSKGSSSFRSTRYLKGVPSPMKRSSSYNGKYLLSWYSRSQRKPNASMNKMHM